MKVHRPLAPYELILLLIFPLTSCVSVHVEPLTHEVYPPKNGPESLQWLEAEPEAPHVKLARISATSQTADEDELREKILARAATLGADAVIMGKSDVLETVGTGSPPQSTMGQAGGSTGGWWPFYYDRWSLAQSPTDKTEFTEYLSGTAIRYVNEK
ncbi:MAG: hypothetical protein P0111_00885 [Nitrospira sp.]|nr:hypothetical protein [Nitrospira sp.]